MRRPDFHSMRTRMVSFVGLDAHTARIRDDLAAGEVREPGNVRVTA